MIAAFLFALLVGQTMPTTGGPRAPYDGEVTLVERDGRRVPAPDGRIVVGVWPQIAKFDDASSMLRMAAPVTAIADIVAGRFHFETFPDSMVIVHRIELAGHVAHVAGNKAFAPSPAMPWRIAADRNFTRVVEIVAAETKSGLGRIAVVRADPPEPDPRPPFRTQSAGVVLLGASSPLELAGLGDDSPRRSNSRFWIRAPHREWKLVSVDFTAAQPLRVELEAAASLTVDLDHPVENGRIDLYPPAPFAGAGERWIDRLPKESIDAAGCGDATHFEFDPIAPGEYAVTMTVRKALVPTAGLAFGRVTVKEHAAATIALAVTTPAPRSAVEFCGTLLFDPAWGATLPELQIWTMPGIDDDANGRQRVHVVNAADYRPVDGTPNLYRWSFGPLPPARWFLRVEGWSMFNNVVVRPTGTPSFDLVYGPPVETLIDVIDEETGILAELDRLNFGVGEKGTDCPRAAVPTAERGRFRLRAPAGPIELSTPQRDFSRLAGSLVIEAGNPKQNVRARRLCGVELHLTLDGTPVRPEGFTAKLVGIDPDLRGAPFPWRSTADGDVLLTVDRPGRYRLEVVSGRGIADVASREVTLARGQFEDLKLELIRAK